MLASSRIVAAAGCSTENERVGVRDFLSSRVGRHFADGLIERMSRIALAEQTLDATITEWCRQRISRATKRHAGIPAGLPALLGWARHFAIRAEVEDDA